MFCKNCGTQLQPGQNNCANCGAPVNVAPVNQAPVQNKKSSNLNGQDKTTMALVCFFLGGIGIHNFMMGETKKGIFKIGMSLLCGIGGILALIDFVKILTDSYQYDPEKLV